MPYDYKTHYTNSEGNTIPALADIEYKTKDWFLGRLFGMSRNVRNGEVPTDTVVTLSPQVPGAALHKINLSGKNSTYSKFNESDGTFYRNTEHQNYFVPVAREAVENAQPRSFKEKFIGIKQQGGLLSPEQQELQYALLGYVVATKKQPKDENEINQIAQLLIQLKQQDPNKYNQLVQLGQQAQAQKAEKGAKINYLKKLKGQCPEGEELVYFKKGGMLNCGCQKKQNGGEVKKPKENKKSNPIEEFKKSKKLEEGGSIYEANLDLLNRINSNKRHANLASNYFNATPTPANLVKGAYHWWMSKPLLGGESEAAVVPQTGVAPLPGMKAKVLKQGKNGSDVAKNLAKKVHKKMGSPYTEGGLFYHADGTWAGGRINGEIPKFVDLIDNAFLMEGM